MSISMRRDRRGTFTEPLILVSVVVGMVTLRALRLHLPPALTVGLLPQIMSHADWRFVLSVALGTTTLTGAISLTRSHLLDHTASPTVG
jgi:hypothetical protein